MVQVSARAGGTVVTVVGLILAAVHLWSAVRLRAAPRLVVAEAVVPLVLALAVAGIGRLLREERLAPAFTDRILGWGVAGTASFLAAVGWLFVDTLLRGQVVPAITQVTLNAVTLGVLAGLVVGVYDARGQCQRRRAEQLTRINDTLRIATQEMVSATERDELEQVVCERLTESDIYDSAWIGRYEPGDEFVRPSAWAGHDLAYIDSLEVTVDQSDPSGQGPGGEAIRTGEIQPVQDVFAEPDLEPWWEMLSEKGVESMAVVPLVGSARAHGFLSVYANRSNVFGPQEREALSELGESTGHAIDSMLDRDRLARRERELARQNQRLDEFASVVSHDLRNPLNVADGNLELVRTEVDDERLGRVADAIDRMDDLIDNLLTLARYGQSVDDVHPIDLRSVAEDAWSTTDTGNARLRFDGEPGTVRADESRLAQLFENLFRNSVEHGSTDSRPGAGDSVEHGSTDSHSESGESRSPDDPETAEFVRGGDADDADVTVTVGGAEDGFYVEDDGPGIPESERERVFQTGYSTTADGTGFGLNIVRTIAEAHGWRVTVTEGTDGGARFEFTTADAEAVGRSA